MTRRRSFWIVAGVAAALVSLFLFRPRTVSAGRAGHGRVSALTGSLLAKGPGDADWSYLDRNGAVRDGDTVWADENSTAEIEMERGAWLRLGPDTRVEVRRLPPDGDLRLLRGSLYVDLAEEIRQGTRVSVPCGEVLVEGGSLARIELAHEDEARVSVRRGYARLDSERGDERRLREGEMATLHQPDCVARVARLNPSELDAFDSWADDRAGYYRDRATGRGARRYVKPGPRSRVAGTRQEQFFPRDRGAYGALPRGVDRYLPGVYDLDDYGDWIDYEGDRCWRPTSIYAGWRPFHDGYWGWWDDRPYWVADEPWGYTTCHYGRWGYQRGPGWLWYPDSVWSPGWVSWAWDRDRVFWSPLDPFDRPVIVRRPRSIGGLLVDALVWSFMGRQNFIRRDRNLIVALNAAPALALAGLLPVRDPRIFIRGLPLREVRIRGRRRTEFLALSARERLLALERRPRRLKFRIDSLPRLEARFRPGLRGRVEKVLGFRQEVRRGAGLTVVAEPVRVRRAQALARNWREARRERLGRIDGRTPRDEDLRPRDAGLAPRREFRKGAGARARRERAEATRLRPGQVVGERRGMAAERRPDRKLEARRRERTEPRRIREPRPVRSGETRGRVGRDRVPRKRESGLRQPGPERHTPQRSLERRHERPNHGHVRGGHREGTAGAAAHRNREARPERARPQREGSGRRHRDAPTAGRAGGGRGEKGKR